MAYTEFTADMNIISALDDEPNDTGGLSASDLKAKFDLGGNTIKGYINGTLLPELPLVTQTLGVSEDKVPCEKAVGDAIASAGNLPAGGSENQVLAKAGGGNYSTKWHTPSFSEITNDGAVEYSQQTLTDGQKGQARANISAAAETHSHTGGDITDLADFITERGTVTAGNYLWNFEKWNSGKYEAWRNDALTGGAFTVQEGALYRCNTIEWTYPAALLSVTDFRISMKCPAAPMMWPAAYEVDETNKIVKFAAFRPTSGTVYTAYRFFIRLTGTWK